MINQSKEFVARFISTEIASGILLVIATICALVATNVPYFTDYYYQFLNFPIELKFSTFALNKSLLLWINDGLMTIFFLVVGLEIKREMLTGHLNSIQSMLLPGFAAVGGMLCPIAIYIFINSGDIVTLRGWAIPSATDIAFALGILALLGSRAPASLKLFLLTLAVLDDLGAIIIIAVFYNHGFSGAYLFYALLVFLILIAMNFARVRNIAVYLLVGLVLWFFILQSGIHSTIAGVLIALTIPRVDTTDIKFNNSVEFIEHKLQYWVSFCILPLFAFANAGVPLSGVSWDILFSNVSIGIILGLVLGKQVGIFFFTWLSVKLGLAKLPKNINLKHIYGVSVLCGIGFTMSLFIGVLSFDNSHLIVGARVGVLLASVISAVLGFIILNYIFNRTATNSNN